MTEFPPRYRDYLSTPEKSAPSVPNPEFRDSTVVMKTRGGSWHAIWQGEEAVLDEFDGTQQDAIDWARQRSARCWVYSEELGDVVLLDADESADQN
jgi:hypothetical protein